MRNNFYLKLTVVCFVLYSCLFAVQVFAEEEWYDRCKCDYLEIGEPPASLLWCDNNPYSYEPLLETKQIIELKSGKNFSVTVNNMGECLSVASSLKAAFGYLLGSAQCFSETCSQTACTVKEESGDVYEVEDKDSPVSVIKWTIDPPNEEKTPIKVDLGEIKEVSITVTGASNIEFGLTKPGEGFKISSSGNTATVTLDTAKGDITGLRQVEVYAVDKDNTSDQLEDDLWFFVDVSCSKKIVGLSCNTPEELKNCETKCNNEYCKMEDTACVKKIFGDTGGTADTTAPAAPAVDMKEYFKGQYPVPPGYVERGGALPPCAFSGTCRNINDLTQLLINFGKGMFAIMGSFAFAFFVYGGFTMIVSMGNAEKQKKGTQILVAAVIGIVIAFSAYMLINFMLEALDVAPDFRGIK